MLPAQAFVVSIVRARTSAMSMRLQPASNDSVGTSIRTFALRSMVICSPLSRRLGWSTFVRNRASNELESVTFRVVQALRSDRDVCMAAFHACLKTLMCEHKQNCHS